MSYVELHACSAFSFLRGGSFPEHIAEGAAALGMAAVALLDRNGVYGAQRFSVKARELGVRPIVGCEVTMEDGSVLPVLVESKTGYANLCTLLTEAHLRSGTKGECNVRWSDLAQRHEGLIALLNQRSADYAQRLIDSLGAGNVYVQLQRHFLRGEERINRELRDLAAQFHLPIVATNGVQYATPQSREVLDVFTCIREHTHLDAAGKLLTQNAERHLKSDAEMRALFWDLPEAITNTERLADRLTFSLENIGYEFPEFPVPDGQTMDSFLREQVWLGARDRYLKMTPQVRAQLEQELALITRLGFAGYFLIVWDLINFCRDNDIMVQGRGSAANSAVCYCLKITPIDPVENNLVFERFLTEARKGWPDIDLDLPSGERRESVIQEVYRRYGKHGAAMTANVITYRGRSAAREIGKALNFSPGILDRFSHLFANGDFPHTMDLPAQIEQAGLPREHPRMPAFVRLYNSIYGLPRHLGQHSGGMIICQNKLSRFVPLENASMPGRVVAQWDKDDCEDLGIVKVD
ncbi:MAG TPA: PHP domain-containing protein, partial [Chthoniobacterales bacterium]